jgi:hypothetical protein
MLGKICDSIVGMTDSNDKVKEIERELELYNVRIRGILTEVNND